MSNLSPIDLHFSQVSSLSLDADHILGHSGSISLGLHELLEPDGSSRLAVGGDMGFTEAVQCHSPGRGFAIGALFCLDQLSVAKKCGIPVPR